MGSGGFAVVIGVLTILGAILLPLILDGVSFSDPIIIYSLIFGIGLGTAFLVVGGFFLVKDSRALAIALIVLFTIYVVDRVVLIGMEFNIMHIVWLALGIMAIIQTVQYLRIPSTQMPQGFGPVPPQQPETPQPPSEFQPLSPPPELS